jgi:hypothetical protein
MEDDDEDMFAVRPLQIDPHERARANWGTAFEKTRPNKLRASNNIAKLIKGLRDVGVIGRPQGTKPLDAHYWLERLDSKHRFSDVLGKLFAEYAAANRGFYRPAFAQWLSGLSDERIAAAVRDSLGLSELTDEEAGLFVKGVAMLDERSRQEYVCTVDGGLLKFQGKALDTASFETAFSGQGFAIFVMSSAGTLYVGSHVVSQFHHSSFLEGQPVLGAGELKAHNGKLQMISAKSGHYKPGPDQLLAVLRKLIDAGVGGIGAVKVRLYPKGRDGQPVANQDGRAVDSLTQKLVPIGTSVPAYVTVWEYVNNAQTRDKYLVWGR